MPYIQARISIFLGYAKQALPQQGNTARCDSLGCCRLPVIFHPESPESQTKCSYANSSLGLDKLSPIHSSGLLLLPSLSGDSVISGTSGEAELIEMLSYHPLCTVSRAPWKSVEETKFLLFPYYVVIRKHPSGNLSASRPLEEVPSKRRRNHIYRMAPTIFHRNPLHLTLKHALLFLGRIFFSLEIWPT